MRTTDPLNLPHIQIFNPDMQNLYDGTQPSVGQRHLYTRHSSYVMLSGGFMRYIPLPSSVGDQEHLSASAGPDSQSHTLPIQSPMTLLDSDLVTVPIPILTLPASVPLSSPLPSDYHILLSSDSASPPSTDYKSGPEA